MNAPVQASQIARPRLGDQLVAQGLISPDQLRIALQEQKNTNQPLGAALLALGFITEDAMRGALAEKLGEQEISLKGVVLARWVTSSSNAASNLRSSRMEVRPL